MGMAIKKRRILMEFRWREVRGMKISVGKDIRHRIAANLLSAHKQMADSGYVDLLIVLTKFILKFSRQFDDDFFELRQEEHDSNSEYPPNKS